MSFLAPLALLWLGSIPVLIWLWRFAATRHRTLVPSLVPFEHLLRRPPTRRTRLLVNALFWLQLAALALLALALAEPALIARHPRTILVVLDTSASMAATTGGASAFQRAQQYLLARLGRKSPGERVFVVRTAPVSALTPEPVSDVSELSQIVERLTPADLGGNLSIARRIGQSLVGARPDATLVLTDEPPPPSHEPDVEFHSFGEALPNVAIVGVDAHEPLCLSTTAQLLVSVQNFADVEQEVTLSVRHDGHLVKETSQRLAPQGRAPISFGLPDGSTGRVEVALNAKHDALAVDNHASITLRGAEAIPVVVASDRSPFLDTIGRWLDACPRIAWKPIHQPEELKGAAAHGGTGSSGALLITDQGELAATWPSAAILFGRQTEAKRLMLTQWLVDATHPIGEYLEPLETVAATVVTPTTQGLWGDPIIWGVAEGRKIPLVRAASAQGRRMVSILLDPTASPSSVPTLLVFLNSLRWLTGSLGLATTGEPLVVGPFEPGVVRIQPPHGMVEFRTHEGGWLRDDSTDRAGLYRFIQGGTTVERVVNFLDPIESNTMKRVSTWGTASLPSASSPGSEPQRQSLVNWLLGLLLVVFLLEWLLYSRKGHAR